MTLAIDGTNHLSPGTTGTSTVTITLTTSNANDIICVSATCNGATITNVSDNSGVTGTWSNQVNGTVCQGASGSNIIDFWWTKATSALSGATLTLTFSNTSWGFATIDVWGVSGANTTTPFDSNASIPVNTNGTDCVISTSNANDMIIAMYRCGIASPTHGTGFTTLSGSGADFQLVEFQIVSATQSSLSCGGGASNTSNGGIALAIQASVAAAPPIFGCILM